MRGRLTIEAVNAALDEAASHSEANHRLMAAARSNSVKPADRKRATTLLHCVGVHMLPQIHSCFPKKLHAHNKQCQKNNIALSARRRTTSNARGIVHLLMSILANFFATIVPADPC